MSIPVINRKKILSDIDACCDKLGISRTEFGQRACNDPALYGRLKKGRDLTLSRIEKVYEYIAADHGKQESGSLAHDLLS